MTTCGYFGVIIPDYNYYQGFFLHEEYVKAAPRGLERIRAGGRDPASLSEVRNPTPGVSAADEGIFGAVTAALVEGARTQNEGLISRSAGIISVLANSRYFMVRGVVEAGGTATSFWRMPPEIGSPDAARDYIHRLPEVLLIQGKLLKEVADQVLNDRKKH